MGSRLFTLLIASGLIDNALDAGLVWRLITLLSVAYILSRGFAKAATRRGESDIARSYGSGAGYNTDPSMVDRATEFAQRHIATRETKEFFKTSEFFVWVITTVGIFIAATTTNEVYFADEAGTHFTWISMAYIVSRGLSKLGTRQDADRGGGRPGY